jgi:hypothetical protein
MPITHHAFAEITQFSDISSAIKLLEKNGETRIPDLKETLENTIQQHVRDTSHYPVREMVEAINRVFKIKSIRSTEELAQAWLLTSYLNGLFCMIANGKDGDVELTLINDTLCRIQQLILNHTKRARIKNKDIALLARYAVARRYYTGTKSVKLLEVLHNAGVLVKHMTHDGFTALYIRGLHAKIGNNVTTIDRLGREHLKYTETLRNQLFCVGGMGENQVDAQAMRASLPFLDKIPQANFTTDEVTYIGYGKNLAKALPVDWTRCAQLLKDKGCL